MLDVACFCDVLSFCKLQTASTRDERGQLGEGLGRERTVRPEGFTSLLSGEYKARDEVPSTALRKIGSGAAAVIAIRLLCIKHTFVESKDMRERRGREGKWRKGAG